MVIADAKETSIQIRALVSASVSGKLWTLRCDVREAMICYVQERHPAHLVKTRVTVQPLPAQSMALPNRRTFLAKRTEPMKAVLLDSLHRSQIFRDSGEKP